MGTMPAQLLSLLMLATVKVLTGARYYLTLDAITALALSLLPLLCSQLELDAIEALDLNSLTQPLR